MAAGPAGATRATDASGTAAPTLSDIPRERHGVQCDSAIIHEDSAARGNFSVAGSAGHAAITATATAAGRAAMTSLASHLVRVSPIAAGATMATAAPGPALAAAPARSTGAASATLGLVPGDGGAQMLSVPPRTNTPPP